MAKNQCWEKQVDENNNEVMVLVEETEVIIPAAIETDAEKIAILETKVAELEAIVNPV